MPGAIQSFDPGTQTCSVLPAIKEPIRTQAGDIISAQLPLLVDCPVYFPSGGNCTLTFPVKRGDECLVVFASRCIDSWWQSGGVQEQAELRMHDLSDGFVYVGVSSKPNVTPNISTTTAQFRSLDGSTYVELDPAAQKVNIVAPGGFFVTAPDSEFSGAVIVRGLFTFVAGMVGSATSGAAAVFNGILNVVGQITANGKRVDDTHTHNGVQPGSGNSGNVN